jgi:hypothetical protein
VFSQFLMEGIGDAATLSPDLVVHRIFESEREPNGARIAPNYINTGFGGNIPGHFFGTLINGQQREQQFISVFANEIVRPPSGPLSGAAVAETFAQTIPPNSTPVLGPPWTIDASPGKATQIYMRRLRAWSPTHNSETTPDMVDSPKLMQTIAHEIGHWLAIDDVPHPQTGPPNNQKPLCPPYATTVMVTKYFAPTKSSNDCAWTHIPHSFAPADLNQLWVK